MSKNPKLLGGRFRYFKFFFCSGRGKGEPEAPGRGGGDRFFIESPRRGGLPGREGRRWRGAGRVSAANWGILWEGG